VQFQREMVPGPPKWAILGVPGSGTPFWTRFLRVRTGSERSRSAPNHQNSAIQMLLGQFWTGFGPVLAGPAKRGPKRGSPAALNKVRG